MHLAYHVIGTLTKRPALANQRWLEISIIDLGAAELRLHDDEFLRPITSIHHNPPSKRQKWPLHGGCPRRPRRLRETTQQYEPMADSRTRTAFSRTCTDACPRRWPPRRRWAIGTRRRRSFSKVTTGS